MVEKGVSKQHSGVSRLIGVLGCRCCAIKGFNFFEDAEPVFSGGHRTPPCVILNRPFISRWGDKSTDFVCLCAC